jgi:hypothetical protein
MLLAPVTNWEPHDVTLSEYCYGMRHGVKVQIVTLYRVSHLNVTALRYAVTLQCVPTFTVRGNATSMYPPIRYAVTLQCVPTFTVRGNVTVCTHLDGTR